MRGSIAWNDSRSPLSMLFWLLDQRTPQGGRLVTDRQLRLCACAWVRLSWDSLGVHSRRAIQAGEDYAEGRIDRDELAGFWAAANGYETHGNSPGRLLRQLARNCAGEHLLKMPHAQGLSEILEVQRGFDPDLVSRQAHLLREVVGDPFRRFCRRCRPLPLRPEWYDRDPRGDWLTRSHLDVQRLAQAAYERLAGPQGECDPLALSILADCLEDAGCPAEITVTLEDVEVLIYGQPPDGWAVHVCHPDLPGHLHQKVLHVARGRKEALAWARENLRPHWRDLPGQRQPRSGTGRMTLSIPHPFLAHLRGPGPHVRGCWVLDLLLDHHQEQ